MATPLKREGPGAGEAVAVLVAWVVLDRLVGWLLGTDSVPTGRYWAIAIARIYETAIFWGYWRARGRTGSDLGLTGPQSRAGFNAGLLGAVVVGGVVALTETAFRMWVRTSFLKAVCGYPSPLGTLPSLLVAGALVGPVFEELLFRGVLYRGLRERLGPTPSIALAALVFASAHQAFAGIHPLQAAGGVLFCLAYEWTDSLWTPLILHVAGNAALFLAPYWL